MPFEEHHAVKFTVEQMFGLSFYMKDLYLMMSLNLKNLQVLTGCSLPSQRVRNG